MTKPFAFGMAKATELTKAGKLSEATALIQSLLGKTEPAEAPPPEDDVLEGTFTRLDDSAGPPKPVPQKPRASLRETLRGIAAGGMPVQAPFATAPAAIPAGAQFLQRSHNSRHGQRDYKLYVPLTRADGPRPLIVMLHGCTQSPDDFAAGTGMNLLAEQHGFLVAYPAQPTGANANKCWNWFKPEDQTRDRGEPALVAGLTRDILRDHGADPRRVYVAGLSAGGAAAAILAAAYPDLYTAVGVHSGLPVGAARDIPQAFSAMRNGAVGTVLKQPVPMITLHGMADATVHPKNGSALVTQSLRAFGALRTTKTRGVSPGGKGYRKTSHSKDGGPTLVEQWEIDGAGHAWAGGNPAGTFTDPAGPDASTEMVRFFLQHAKG